MDHSIGVICIRHIFVPDEVSDNPPDFLNYVHFRGLSETVIKERSPLKGILKFVSKSMTQSYIGVLHLSGPYWILLIKGPSTSSFWSLCGPTLKETLSSIRMVRERCSLLVTKISTVNYITSDIDPRQDSRNVCSRVT